MASSDNGGSSKCWGKMKQFFSCPPQGPLERLLTHGILLILSWSVPWAVVGEDCLPGGNIFSLIIVIDSCFVAGRLMPLFEFCPLPPLPPLLAMLVCGFCLRNIPAIDIAKNIDPTWSSTLRSIALSLILVKAGLELDASALKKMKSVCLRLTVIPCIVETATCAVTSKLLLGFPWEWGILLGFVLGAVTPAIIVPSMLSLQDKGYGVGKGIPTLVIAASSFDDVFAITGFSVTLGIVLSEGSAGLVILRGVGEVVVGIVIGVVIGWILRFLPAKSLEQTDQNRLLLVVGCGISVLLGSERIGFPGAGAMGAIVSAFVAAGSWGDSKSIVSEMVGHLWVVFEPILFGLIGAEVSLEEIDTKSLGLSFAVLLIGLGTRSVASFLSVSWGGFSNKEKLFVCFAWLPKATVQAAIGSVALTSVRKNQSDDDSSEILAMQVLTISVMSIMITAPLGAAAIAMSGPKLLSKSESHSSVSEDNHHVVTDCMEEIPLRDLNRGKGDLQQ